MGETKTNLSDVIKKMEQLENDVWVFEMIARDEKVF
jgi:hypothetical protein